MGMRCKNFERRKILFRSSHFIGIDIHCTINILTASSERKSLRRSHDAMKVSEPSERRLVP
jgi:hypothetical protein